MSDTRHEIDSNPRGRKKRPEKGKKVDKSVKRQKKKDTKEQECQSQYTSIGEGITIEFRGITRKTSSSLDATIRKQTVKLVREEK
jgi:hypothetical protein